MTDTQSAGHRQTLQNFNAAIFTLPPPDTEAFIANFAEDARWVLLSFQSLYTGK